MLNFQLYSLAQKHCTKFSNEKSLVFLTVNLHEILHASTYTLYAYIHKVKNLPQMATLTYSNFGNPGGSYHRAHYSLFLVPTFDLWRRRRPLIYKYTM